MSQMNLLETNARYSVAISILNSFRHWLAGREGTDFNEEDKDIFLESIIMKQENELSPKMILYSLQGFSNNEHSAAIELSDALSKALETLFEGEEQEAYLNRLKYLLESKNKDSINDTERNSIMKLITNTMQLISNAMERKPKSAFTWKSL
jgi:hypothetical protein